MNNKEIIFDNIIYSLQNIGGISRYWTELIKRILTKDNLSFYEKENNNLLEKKLILQS